MPSEHYMARIVHTMELDGSITLEHFGDRDRCTEITLRVNDPPTSADIIKALINLGYYKDVMRYMMKTNDA